MKLNPKINFKIVVGILAIIEIVAITIAMGLFGHLINTNILGGIMTIGLTLVPALLFILGIYGLIKKEDHSYSVVALFLGIVVPLIVIGQLKKGFS